MSLLFLVANGMIVCRTFLPGASWVTVLIRRSLNLRDRCGKNNVINFIKKLEILQPFVITF